MSEDLLLKQAKEEFDRGAYSSALQLLNRIPPNKRSLEERDCLICECLQFKGEFDRVIGIAESRIKEGADPELTARYWEVIGRVRLEQMRREEATEAFRKGIRSAQNISNLSVLASLQQLRLIAAGESLGSTLLPAVRDAYHTAVRSADPATLAGFHVRLARLEGQRGAFDRSLHHLSLAKSLLNRRPHLALLALYHVNKSCVLAMAGSFSAARRNGEEGANLAEQAGHIRLATCGAATVSYIAIATGDLSVADSWLRKARKLAHQVGFSDIALLDNLAALALVRGETDRAAVHVAEIRAVFDSRDLKWCSSNEILTLFTELHLNKQLGDRERFTATLQTIRAASNRLEDPHSGLLADLAESEDLFDQEKHALARTKTNASVNRALEHLVYLSQLERNIGRDFWLAGHRNSAYRMLARASSSAVLRSTRLDWSVVLKEVRDIGRSEKWDTAYSLSEQFSHADARFAALMKSSRPGWFATTQSSEDVPRDPVDGFDDAVGILRVSADPSLVGREALASAIALDVAEAGVLVAHTDAGIRAIAKVEAEGYSVEDILKDRSCERLMIGKAGHQQLELVLKAKADIRSTVVIAGLRRLVNAAHALELRQKDQQRLDALWQPEVIVEEADAVFSSPLTIELMQTARKVAVTTLPVLLMGPTGTGKEVIARAIHRASPRAGRIFLPFNCSAVPRDMIESQLFGSKRGAFTGATDDFLGVIRTAEGGTLFLDEIGELSMDLQPKLLRFLETNEVHPLGEGKPIKVDVRVIAATNADLEELIQRKEFREDLYYRLNIVRFHMPTLAERREEIPALAAHLLRRFEMDEKKHSITISDELMEYLLLYKWPGNVRQLSNELRKMVAMVDSGSTLLPEHIAPAIRATRKTVPVAEGEAEPAPPADAPAQEPTALSVRLDQPLPGAIEALERAMIEHAIARADGKIEEAARLLGISRKGLFLKRRRWHTGGEPPSRSA